MTTIGTEKAALDTPALWVDLDKLERNIAYLVDHFTTAGVQWRPHIKGIKSPAIAHKLLAAGAIGVTCAKLGEAEVMAAAGITDMLIANQVVGPTKITRLVNLARQVDVKVAVDHPDNVAQLGRAAVEKGVELGVLVEVDTGMNRCGVTPGEATVDLARQIHTTAGLRLMGLMAWEGHTVAIEDAAQKEQAVEQSLSLLAGTTDLCRRAGLPVDIVSGGGSGTYLITPFLNSTITEVQAGGAIFNDETYTAWGVKTEPALFVRTMVVSRPTPERIIFDAGFKALPVWGGRMPRSAELTNVKQLRASAEHGVVTLDQANTTIQPGDAFDFIPGYTDMTLFLYDELVGVRDGIVEAVWPISARGKLK